MAHLMQQLLSKFYSSVAEQRTVVIGIGEGGFRTSCEFLTCVGSEDLCVFSVEVDSKLLGFVGGGLRCG